MQRGMGGEVFFVALLLSPPPCAYQRHAQKGPDTELQPRHITHPRKALRGHNAEKTQLLGHSERWRRIDLFVFPQPNKGGGLGGKGGGAFPAPDPITGCFFFMAVTLEVGGGESPTFSV